MRTFARLLMAISLTFALPLYGCQPSSDGDDEVTQVGPEGGTPSEMGGMNTAMGGADTPPPQPGGNDMMGMGGQAAEGGAMGMGGTPEMMDPFGTFERCPNYPAFNPVMGYNEVVPPIGWTEAYMGDGTQRHFSFENYFCGEDYADSTILILIVSAGWCQPCSRFAQAYLNPRAPNLTENLGVEIVYLEAQDTQGMPADNRFAYRHLRDLIDDGAGWRVGDLNTVIREGDEMVPVPNYFASQANIRGFPTVWVIRKRDMRIIATRSLAFMARPGELPFELIAMDPEQDWSAPPPPPFNNLCEEGDEEETEEENNNRMRDATFIESGVHTGGICDIYPDFYTFTPDGQWRFTLEFDASQGDLDLVLWDKRNDTAVVGEDGNPVGSFGTGGVETLTGEGRSFVQVYGYNAASASYTIRLEDL